MENARSGRLLQERRSQHRLRATLAGFTVVPRGENRPRPGTSQLPAHTKRRADSGPRRFVAQIPIRDARWFRSTGDGLDQSPGRSLERRFPTRERERRSGAFIGTSGSASRHTGHSSHSGKAWASSDSIVLPNPTRMSQSRSAVRIASREFSVTCETSCDGRKHIVRIHGELDLMNVPHLREMITALDGDIDLDCRDLQFIDSSGFGLLVMVNALQRQRGRTLSIRRVTRRCYQAFAITRLNEHLDVQSE
jgi:anti-anti-sigma factor